MTNIIDATGTNYDRMQPIGSSPTAVMYYDQCETQCFYLLTLATKTLSRVSPLYAKNWLMNTGAAANWAYNPFNTPGVSCFDTPPGQTYSDIA
jgi:hypothetical protein